MDRKSGFTLIELILTVTIVSILAVVAMTLINPAETIRRVKDELKKTDINALLSSIDIYYITALQYPWGEPGEEFFGEVIDPEVGVCDSQGVNETGCVGYGNLITSANIKDVFANRDYFKSTANFDDKLFVISPADDVPSVCYIPLSRETRKSWSDEELDLRVLNFNESDELRDAESALCSGMATAPSWDSLENSCFHCIPLKLGLTGE